LQENGDCNRRWLFGNSCSGLFDSDCDCQHSKLDILGRYMMSEIDLKDKYNSFQKDAVDAIVRDFSQKRAGRYLLVIPTGGGKTYTAVKATCKLFDSGILDSNDRILWTAHRRELITQAEETFEEYLEQNDSEAIPGENIIFEMLSSVSRRLEKDHEIKIVVIDEAHHGAASSYKPIFDKETIGVLGLTATPSRHDGKPLDFDRESFSIGFPDLVKKGLILKPEISFVDGGSYNIGGFSDEDLDELNNHTRNQKIIDELSSNVDMYRKVIIFVGTMKHAEYLHEILKDSELKNYYESIAYITGQGNSRNQSPEEFIETEKKFSRSILINVQKLSEGYDDPGLNTVVMATPSRSKLYYMQALGRVVRKNPEDPLKRAFVVEVVDDLPNIRYRIDNRWLYADISDVLEPEVEDFNFSSEAEFVRQIQGIYNKYNVPKDCQSFPKYNEFYRYTLLLFKQYAGEGAYINYPLLIDNDNRTRVSNVFNFISERMENFRKKNINYEQVFQMLGPDSSLFNKKLKKLIYDAMSNASILCTSEDKIVGYVKDGFPWITFVALNYREEEIDLHDELREFVNVMVNRDEVVELLLTKSYELGSVLIRLPLPFNSYVGKIISYPEFKRIELIISSLQNIKNNNKDKEHISLVGEVLSNSVLPIEIMYRNSLSLIVRDNIDYHISLL